jgi:hypothetical protein
MAVQTTYLKGDGSALGNTDAGNLFTIPFTIDTASTNVTSGDVLKLMNIPANTLITDVIANVTTAEGGTLTIDIGDYTASTDAAIDADGFIDGANGNSAAATKTTDGTIATPTPAYIKGKVYTATGAYLGVLFNNAADAAIIEITVIAVKLR